MQTLNILFVLWVAVANAYPMSVSERPTNLEHELESPPTGTVTEADNLEALEMPKDEEELGNGDVAEMWGPLSKHIRKINTGISNTVTKALKEQRVRCSSCSSVGLRRRVRWCRGV